MRILAIESSCDETAASVVANGREMLSSVVASQTDIHAIYGGVVPEIASRAHTEALTGVVERALTKANTTLTDLTAIAVTNSPGLIGALLTGVSFAKGLSLSSGLPLVPVHHIRGHVAANYLVHPDLKPPFIALVVSGGHTSLLKVSDYTNYQTIGATRDDAAGEAFDKAARVLGLPYPGGAVMDKLATQGNADALHFPVSHLIEGAEYDFSFSGLKTAVINHVHKETMKNGALPDDKKADVAASFTKAVIATITTRLEPLLDKDPLPLVLSGGVAANSHLRAALTTLTNERGIPLYMPPLSLCGDNAAMIASQGYFEYLAGNLAPLNLNAYATKSV